MADVNIYRVEGQRGEGPYTSLGTYYWTNRDHNDSDHPCPAEEGLSIFGLKCGFESTDKLHSWFTNEELDTLVNEHDFRIVRFTVPESVVQYGLRQVTFDVDRATDRDIIRERRT